MKHTKSIVAVLAIALFTVAVSVRSQSQKAPSTISPASVVLLATPNYDAVSGEYKGIVVYAASSSADAPQFPQYPHPGAQLAEAEAQLLNAGFHLMQADNFSYHLIR